MSKTGSSSSKNPWITISTRLVYENPWIRLREDQVISPTGKEGIYGVVEARLAVGVVALTEDNCVYMVGQHRYPNDIYSWEIPEGGAEDGESPLEAAQRELVEETGITASSWEPLGGEVHLSNCFTSERAFIFLARGLTRGSSAPDETELLAIKKMALSDAIQMAEKGERQDGLSMIALLHVARRLGF